jgi:hypothetical protein
LEHFVVVGDGKGSHFMHLLPNALRLTLQTRYLHCSACQFELKQLGFTAAYHLTQPHTLQQSVKPAHAYHRGTLNILIDFKQGITMSGSCQPDNAAELIATSTQEFVVGSSEQAVC